jgi:glutathione S-transferase
VLEDGDLVVWESHAILRYLAAARAPDRFWPATPAARSHVDRWMDWSQTSLQADVLGGLFWGFFRTPPALRNQAAIDLSVAACARHFRLLDDWLATRAFLCGEDFSLADIPAGALLYRYFELEIERPRAPHVEAWYRRLQARPAYRARVMVGFEDLRGRLAF